MVWIQVILWVTGRGNSPLPMVPQERQFWNAHNFRFGLPTHLPTWLALMCYLSEVQGLFFWVLLLVKSGTAVPLLWPQRELSHLPQVLISMGEVHLSPDHADIWEVDLVCLFSLLQAWLTHTSTTGLRLLFCPGKLQSLLSEYCSWSWAWTDLLLLWQGPVFLTCLRHWWVRGNRHCYPAYATTRQMNNGNSSPMLTSLYLDQPFLH